MNTPNNYPQLTYDHENKVVSVPYTIEIPKDLLEQWNNTGWTVQLSIV